MIRRALEPEPLLASVVDRSVAFIVIGGYAVAAHGFPRATKDIDICPEPSTANLERLAAALADLEAEPIGSKRLGGNWTVETKHGRLDVRQHLAGLGDDGGGWKELRPQAVTRRFLGHDCLFCSYEDLLRMKAAADRDQDRVDVKTLLAIRNEDPRS